MAAQLQALGELLDAAPPDLTPAEASRVVGSMDRLSRYVGPIAGRLGETHEPQRFAAVTAVEALDPRD